ncbi:MAG: SEC-C metal-binding domain-containing protein [Anaerolineae bacterium]|nr:SEC-C metal-binding domain-containing protein [Anaerolineae bacterium]
MFKKLVTKIIGDPNQKILNELQEIVDEVNDLELQIQKMSAEQLRDRTYALREMVQAGTDLEDVLPEAFAMVREASVRTTGMRHYDVQIMGGILLHRMNVIEMRTGEGKTLVATLPLYLNALPGQGAHLVTVNEYLARRDGGWMGSIYHYLGLSTAVIGPQQFSAIFDPDYVNPGADLEDERLVHWRPCTRTEAYQADITYGISSEFGFDYLRDNMVTNAEQLVQRSHYFAIIDEVDNVLIDEARTPLIISGPAPRSGKDYARFADYVRGLRENTEPEDMPPDGDYDIDHKSRSITLTEIGIAEIERRVPEIDHEGGDSLYDPRFYHLTYYLDNALKAQYMFHRDKEYVVKDGEVIIVDDFTGRLMPGRRYSDGLHEAIEAKERVEIKRETVTVATITLQNYFRMYDQLAGMTGTAVTDAEEFDKFYSLGVFPLPTNVEYIVERTNRGLVEQRIKEDGAEKVTYLDPKTQEPVFFKRVDYKDQVYSTLEAKDKAILEEIERVHTQGRPILVGTTSVEHSEQIAESLKRRKMKFNVLNAKMHQSEALTVAQAGRRGAVTISTNMAGRGTDILLGGNAEGLAAETLEAEMFDRNALKLLAKTWQVDGEEAARISAENNPKLKPELVDALIAVKTEFDDAMIAIDEQTMTGYLSRRMQEDYNVDFSHIRQVMRRVQANQLQEAREYLAELDVDMAMVEDITRLQDMYSRYQMARQHELHIANFLGDMLFERHYNARAALIRSTLGGDLDEAQRLTKTIPALEEMWIDRILQIKKDTEEERRKVWELGGLHVVGSERHESRRIDNQLRGRAARQGDPGSSRFFLSLEDDLMLRFGGERLNNFMNRFNIPDDMPIENNVLDRLIESSQTRLEGYNFDIRKNVVEYDDVMNMQRRAIYGERKRILLGETIDLDAKVHDAFADVIDELAHNYIDDYIGYVERELDQAIGAYSTDATDQVNVTGVLIRMRGLLPDVMQLDRTELADLTASQLRARLLPLVQKNLEEGVNLYQLLRAMSRFIPIMPAIPNVGASLAGRRDRLPARESLRRAFLTQVEELNNEFLAQQLDSAEKDALWQETNRQINDAFVRYNVEGVSVDVLRDQQDKFKERVEEALQKLLLDSLEKLNSEQLVAALNMYVAKRCDNWKERIGEEEYRQFQRTLLLSAIDREWRDYLTAMDDLRREIGLAAVAQRDPKVEYKRRSYEMFQDMRHNIDEDIANRFFRDIAQHQAFVREQEHQAQVQTQLNQGGYVVVQKKTGKGTEVRRDSPKVGRNDLCPCGSGKKYKHCHMRQDEKAAKVAAVGGNGSGRSAQSAGKSKSKKQKRRRR